VRLTKVLPEISRMIGDCRLTRAGLVRVLAGLHGELPQHYDLYKAGVIPRTIGCFCFPTPSRIAVSCTPSLSPLTMPRRRST
jgi:hypothetical protein